MSYPDIGIKLGQEVEDRTSGFKGIANSIIELLSGTIQVGIQPRSDDGSFKDSMAVDYQVVKVIGDGIIKEVALPKIERTDIRLGMRVVDVISGAEGITVCKVTYLNGCITFSIDLGVDKDGKPMPREFSNCKHLRQVESFWTKMKKWLAGPKPYPLPIGVEVTETDRKGVVSSEDTPPSQRTGGAPTRGRSIPRR